MSVPQIIGWAACVLCTSAFLLDYFAPTPPGGFSWLWFTLFTPGITLWAVQALIMKNPPLIVANSIVVVVLLHRIYRILRAPRAASSSPPRHAEASAATASAPAPTEAPQVARATAMPSPRAMHPDELRERATRMVVEAQRNPVMAVGSIERVAGQLGLHPETVRGWVERAEYDAGRWPNTHSNGAWANPHTAEAWTNPPSSEAQRIAELEQENREIRRANAILKSASAYFAAELDRPSRFAEIDPPVR